MSALKVILFARDFTPRVQAEWSRLSQFLARQPQVRVLAETTCGELTLPPEDADLVLVLGGDGAILRACHQLGERQQPVLGINLGRLGFLADLSPDEFFENFERIQRRQYRVVDHLMFECTLRRSGGQSETFLGLNEAAIRASGLQMIDVDLTIDGEPVTTFSGDGLIVSTPVGSTAHSLSAGGPLLQQDLQAFVVTPICPHSLANRPLVDHADRVYTLDVPNADAGATLVVDGQIRRPLGPDDCVEVRKAKVSFKMARIPGHSYYGMLHRKLGWSGQTRARVPGERD